MPDMGDVLNLVYWFIVIAVAINFVNFFAGLLSAVTGRSHAPAPFRRLRRNVAATPGDQRMLGMTLLLLSVGQLSMMIALLIVVTLAAAQATGGHAPIFGLYLVALVSFLASVASTFASLALGLHVSYRDANTDPEGESVRMGRPEMPAD
jgi:uncharacterized membrane protein YbhN (UPF0104 family)